MDAEQIVEQMNVNGRRIMDEAMSIYKPVAIMAAYSSGDDSSVSTHFAMTNYPDCFVFNADTLVGLSPPRCHLRAVCERFKWHLEIEQAYAEGPPKKMRQGGRLVPFDAQVAFGHEWRDGATAYEEFVLNHGFPGTGKPQHSWMYQRLKERPIRRMLKRFGAGQAEGKPKVLIVSGIRADESAIRAGYQCTVAKGQFGDVWVSPFYFHTKSDFELYREEHGLPRNPTKRLTGISGECCCGTFGSSDERQAYAKADPAFHAYLADLEARVKSLGFPWGWGESPPQWWLDQRRGQHMLFEMQPVGFQPMCVGCNSGRR